MKTASWVNGRLGPEKRIIQFALVEHCLLDQVWATTTQYHNSVNLAFHQDQHHEDFVVAHPGLFIKVGTRQGIHDFR